MEHTGYCDRLVAELDRIGATVADVADEAWRTRVPSCPDWDLAALVEHLGGIHRWVAQMVREQSQQRLRREQMDLAVPDDVADYSEWFSSGCSALVSALRACDPDAPMWSWGADQHARFWSRRMLYETAVHHADARLALGLEPTLTIDAPTAAGGVDELLDNLPSAAYFAPDVVNLRGAGETIHLHATDMGDDPAGEVTITLHPDGYSYEHSHGKGTVAVRGTAADLLLLSCNRRSLDGDADRFQVFGDRPVLDHWLANAAL